MLERFELDREVLIDGGDTGVADASHETSRMDLDLVDLASQNRESKPNETPFSVSQPRLF